MSEQSHPSALAACWLCIYACTVDGLFSLMDVTKKPLPFLAQYRGKLTEDVSRLTIKKSARFYNDMGRTLPGVEILYFGKRYVLRARQTNGTKYYTEGRKQYFPSKKCSVARHNTGLVFI